MSFLMCEDIYIPISVQLFYWTSVLSFRMVLQTTTTLNSELESESWELVKCCKFVQPIFSRVLLHVQNISSCSSVNVDGLLKFSLTFHSLFCNNGLQIIYACIIFVFSSIFLCYKLHITLHYVSSIFQHTEATFICDLCCILTRMTSAAGAARTYISSKNLLTGIVSIGRWTKQTVSILLDFLSQLLVYQSSLHFRLEKVLAVFSVQCLSL